MKAVVADAFGGNWSIRELPDPEPGPDEVVVKIEASGICYTDIQQLMNPNYHGTFPRVPGHEPVGVIVARGASVDSLELGTRVGAAYVQRWCGACAHCEKGRYEHCAAISATGVSIDGGHAELMVAHAASLEPIPPDIDPAEAAPIMCAGYTVYSGIKDCALEPGERCAVIGVGGLGHLAIQYATALGAEVVAVTRDTSKEPLLRALGAASVVVPTDGKVGHALREIGGVDVMLHTANRAETELLKGLRPYGRLSLMGVTSDAVAASAQDMVFGKLTIVGSSQGPRTRLREVLELHARSGAKTAVERYSLDDALSGFARVESGSARFRAVLTP